MAGIKESLELLEGVKMLAADVKKVMADGKVDMADIGVLMDLLSQFSVLSEAVKGADQISMEVKDLSAEEINELVPKVLEIVAVIRA